MAGIKLVGMTNLEKAVAKGLDLSAVKTVVRKNGDSLNKRMKENASKTGAFKKGYSTGDTANSINTDLSNGGMTATVQPTTNYAAYVEFGTRKMEAEPFVRPAFEEQVKEFVSDMKALTR